MCRCRPRGDEARARAFYGELLMLMEVAQPSEVAQRSGCWFVLPEGTCGQLHVGVE